MMIITNNNVIYIYINNNNNNNDNNNHKNDDDDDDDDEVLLEIELILALLLTLWILFYGVMETTSCQQKNKMEVPPRRVQSLTLSIKLFKIARFPLNLNNGW
jgi:hypothetical protein